MDTALELAEGALKAEEVPVGCVMLYNNEIIAASRNNVNETKNAARHAELNCIDQVIDWCKEKEKDFNEVFRNVHVVVTVEPCIMCCAALRNIGVVHVTYGCANDKFGGCGTILSVHNDKILIKGEELNVTSGVRKEEALLLLQRFYETENSNAPIPKKRNSETKCKETLQEDS